MAVRGGGRAILGFGFMAVGATFVWGGLTGRLAPMLAALFAPDDLTNQTAPGSAARAGQIAGQIGVSEIPNIISGGVIP